MKQAYGKTILFSFFCFSRWSSSAPSVVRPPRSRRLKPRFASKSNMVQLNVAVMDSKGNYVTGLRPSDFVVTEDGIPQKVATFGEGNEATRRVTSDGSDRKAGRLASRPQWLGGVTETILGAGLRARLDDGGRQRFHPVRHQQLHVPRFCFRPGCDLPSLSARSTVPTGWRFIPTAATFPAPPR